MSKMEYLWKYPLPAYYKRSMFDHIVWQVITINTNFIWKLFLADFLQFWVWSSNCELRCGFNAYVTTAQNVQGTKNRSIIRLKKSFYKCTSAIPKLVSPNIGTFLNKLSGVSHKKIFIWQGVKKVPTVCECQRWNYLN